MKDTLINLGFKWIAPLVMSLALPHIMQAMKQHNAWLAKQSATVQRLVVAVLAGLATMASAYTGVELGADPTLWADTEWQALLLAGMATAFHAGDRSKAARRKRATKPKPKAIDGEDAPPVNRTVAAVLARDMEEAGENPFAIPPAAVRLADGSEL